MNTNTKLPIPDIVRQCWNEVSAQMLGRMKSISLRTDTGGDTPMLINVAPWNYNPLIDLSFTSDLVKHCFSTQMLDGADALTITSAALVTSTTVNCLEVDTSLHRTTDLMGVIVDDGEALSILSETVAPQIFHIPAEKQRYYSGDSITVTVHDVDTSPVNLTYAGSFEISETDISDWCSPELLEREDDDIDEGRLVCDLHEGKDGLRSITITKNANTVDGPVRRVVYNDLHI